MTFRCAGRRPLFDRIDLGKIVVDEMHRSDASLATKTYGFVVMPDHVHWLFELRSDRTLSQVVRSLKGRSSRHVNEARNATGAVWQPGFHDRALRRTESLREVGYYIVNNPVRAGLVTCYSEYPLLYAEWL